ncbi:gas vesicle protein K [Methylocystis hirsuta]|uniref:Gas vesicle protein K n=1 Tax=Methylocystis hirsuta TaxID=369798 RepID=A0A3M9XRG9_9HYPH|nr:gas vesicle protein K [Methylocystis hirsuta]RNJ50591.1 gas vesicle protein K [Methylocystis hirsuta]
MPTAMPVPDSGPSNAAPPYRDHLSLADALDRILQRGVSVQGNLTIGLADVDLLFLDLRLLLGSVDAIWPDGAPPVPAVCPRTPPSPPSPPSPPPPSPASSETPAARPEIGSRDVALGRVDGGPPIALNDRRSADGSSPAQGLVRLVLTLVKLLHEVLERQAVRRMEAGRLTDAQIDNVGMALIAQAEEILRLQRQFGFSDRDISLDLGVPDGAL